MPRQSSLARAAWVLAYAVLGLVGTVAVALVLLPVTDPLQRPVYDALYLRLGPTDATQTAILAHFVLAAVVAVAVPALLADYLDERLANRRALAIGIAGLVGLAVAFLVVALAGLGSLPATIGLLAVGIVGIAALLRSRLDVRSGAVPALLGAVPAVAFLMLLAGLGLGWGWGFYVTAQEAPASSVDESAVVAFDAAPELRDDLFAADRCETDDGLETCQLQLRGYDHEVATARALADHGVRCPYQNDPAGDGGSAVVRNDGTYYRVSCAPHGD